jgi:hypothetical protein
VNEVVVLSGPSAHTTTGSALTLVVPLLSLLLLFALAWFMRRRLLSGAGPLAAGMPPSPDPLSPERAADATAERTTSAAPPPGPESPGQPRPPEPPEP